MTEEIEMGEQMDGEHVTVERITLSQDELAAGLHFEREIAMAQANMQQASMARNVFIKYLKAAKGVPADWEIRDWQEGFEPQMDPEHSH